MSEKKAKDAEPVRPAGWPGAHGYPQEMGRGWWHWLKNNITGAYHCAWWEREQQRWRWILSKQPIPAEKLPPTWDYLGPAMPPPEEVRKIMNDAEAVRRIA